MKNKPDSDSKTIKIVLVNSPKQFEGEYNANYGIFPHTGLAIVASQVKKDHGDNIELKVIDGDLQDVKDIEKQINEFKPDVVGISVLTQTWKNALEIALNTKKHNPKTKIILGNDGAFFHGKTELEKGNEVFDGIITNDMGHIGFSQYISHLLNKLEIEKVDSLMYKNGDVIRQNLSKKFSMKEYNPDLDFSYFDNTIKEFAENYNKTFLSDEYFFVPLIVNNARGCYNVNNRCMYCSIGDLTINIGDANNYWRLLEKAHDYALSKFGKNHNGKKTSIIAFEVFDSLFSNKKYIEDLIKNKPKSIKTMLDIGTIQQIFYINATHASKEENANFLKDLQVKMVNIGLDSGSKTIAQLKSGKDSLETNTKALENMKKLGIKVHASFILGAEGETTETVKDTVEYIKNIVKNLHHPEKQLFSAIEVSMFVPLPMAKSWDKIMEKYKTGIWKNPKNKEVFEKYLENKEYPLEPIKKLWLEEFTDIKYEFLVKTLKEIDQILIKEGIVIGKNVG